MSSNSAAKNLRKKLFSLTPSQHLQILIAAAGTFLSLYLLVQHTKLKTGIQEGPSFCSWGAGFDCDAVNISSYSEIFGVPLAAIGAVFYFTVTILSMMRLYPVLTWLSLAALAVDLALFLVQAVALSNYCILCLVTYACSLGIFLTNMKILTGSLSLSGANLNLARRQPVAKPRIELILVAGIALICFAAYVHTLPEAIQARSQSFNMVRNALEQFFAQWGEQQSKKIALRADDASFGNPAASVQVVEFSDFECPHCKRAAFVLDLVLAGYREQVHFTFKNFPLDSSCNKAVPYQMHPHACVLASLGKCAHRKGKFREYHELIFHKSGEDKSEAVVQELLRGIFSPEEFAACLADTKVKKEIQDDISEGTALGLRGTPSVYINGKLVSIPLTAQNLTRLIEIEKGLSNSKK